MGIFNKKKLDEKTIAYSKTKEKVMELHKNATFLMYIDDAYIKQPHGQIIEGIVAIGKAQVDKEFLVYSCEGEYVTAIAIKEAYVKNDIVNMIEGGDKRVSIYLEEENDKLIAGQLMVII